MTGPGGEGWSRKVARFPLTRLAVAALLYGTSFLVAPPIAQLLPDGPAQWAAAKAVGAAFALLALGVTVRWMEGRPLSELGGPPRLAARELGLGFAAAAGLVSACIAVFAAFGWYRAYGVALDVSFAVYAALFLFVSIEEELLFRGILFRAVEDGLGSWAALGVSGLFFGFAHAFNQNATLVTSLAIAVEAGLLLGAVYMLTRRLWAVFGLHWAWNLFEGPVWGTRVSGMVFPGVVDSFLIGPEAWTGGAFGPEGGLVMVLGCSAVTAWLLVRAVRSGRVRAPAWARGEAP